MSVLATRAAPPQSPELPMQPALGDEFALEMQRATAAENADGGKAIPPAIQWISDVPHGPLAQAELRRDEPFLPDSALPTPTGALPDIKALRQARDHAELAQDVYTKETGTLPSGWSEMTPRELAEIGLTFKDLNPTVQVRVPGSREERIPPRVEDREIGIDLKAYKHEDGRITIAFRGTDLAQEVGAAGEDALGDVAANYRQAVGDRSAYYDHAIKVGRKVATSRQGSQAYAGKAPEIQFTGHSLGGGLASAASVASGLPADTFNAAGLAEETRRSALETFGTVTERNGGKPRTPPDVTAYVVPGDIITSLQDGRELLHNDQRGATYNQAMRTFNETLGDIDGSTPDTHGKVVILNAVGSSGRPEGLLPLRGNGAVGAIREGLDRHNFEFIDPSLDDAIQRREDISDDFR